jgi:UDP-N-acetylmuramate dehydrogenase
MAKYSTLKVGGPALALVVPTNVAEIVSLITGCCNENIPWLVVGGGSNLLVADAGFAGVVIILGRDFSDIRITGKESSGSTLVEVDAGCRLAKLLNWCQENSMGGLEFMAGIPGSVGGAVVMNAGAVGLEIKDVLSSVTWLESGQVVKRDRTELDFGYRHCNRPVDSVILSATFTFTTKDRLEISKTCRNHIAARKIKQPSIFGSAGSFFKNPENVAAGKLIEDAGLKGLKVGGAEVSEVHANFIVNTGDATASNIIKLMKMVQAKVLEVHGVKLEPEVNIIGADREIAVGAE